MISSPIYLFIPSVNVEGRLQPILVVLCIRETVLLLNLTLLLAGLFLIAPQLPALWYELLGNPILFEFVIGAGIATVLAIAELSLCIIAMMLAGHHGDRLVAIGLSAAILFILFILFFMLETRTVFRAGSCSSVMPPTRCTSSTSWRCIRYLVP